MPEITYAEVDAAVREVLAAREAAIVGLRLSDPEDRSQPYPVAPLPEAADPEAIAGAEQALGVRLPASYRHFLSLHDGLEDIDLGSDLLGAQALTQFNRGGAEEILAGILDEIDRKTTKGLIVLGTTKSDTSVFIFDSNKADEFGEWPVIEYDAEDGLLDEYDNFLEFLEDTADTVRLMAGSRR